MCLISRPVCMFVVFSRIAEGLGAEDAIVTLVPGFRSRHFWPTLSWTLIQKSSYLLLLKVLWKTNLFDHKLTLFFEDSLHLSLIIDPINFLKWIYKIKFALKSEKLEAIFLQRSHEKWNPLTFYLSKYLPFSLEQMNRRENLSILE